MKLEIQDFRIEMILRELEVYEAKYSIERNEDPPKPTPEERFNYLHALLSAVRYAIGTPNGSSVVEHAKALMEAIGQGESFEIIRHKRRVDYYAYHRTEYIDSEAGLEAVKDGLGHVVIRDIPR